MIMRGDGIVMLKRTRYIGRIWGSEGVSFKDVECGRGDGREAG